MPYTCPGRGGKQVLDLFFVLSAFCLTYPMFLKWEVPTNWSRYFRNRVVRIAPPYWASVARWVVLWGAIQATQIEPWYSENLLGWPRPLVVIAGLLLIVTIYNGSYWTLCVEARWYLILPLIMWMLRRIGMAWVLGFACLASVAYYLALLYADTRGVWRVIYFATALPLFLPTFVLGIYVARSVAFGGQVRSARFIRLLRLAFFLALALTGLLLPEEQQLDLLRAGVGGVFASTLLALAIYDPWSAKVLSWKPLEYIGTISYSLYLIHEPLIRLACSMTRPWNWPEWQQFCFYELLFPAFLILLASAFHRAFEAPWIRRPAQPVTRPFGSTSSD